MEKTKAGVVVPFNGNWSDIGSWESLWDSKLKDNNNNYSEGDVILSKVKNSYIHSSNRLVSVNELSDLVIIDTQDALLVSSKKGSQDIKKIVEILHNYLPPIFYTLLIQFFAFFIIKFYSSHEFCLTGYGHIFMKFKLWATSQ